MQSAGWYVQRLRTMSALEVLWRMQSKARGYLDRAAFSRRKRPIPIRSIAASGGPEALLSPLVLGAHLASGETPAKTPGPWRDACMSSADAVADHRLTFFNLENLDLGREINWNYEYQAKKPTPMGFTDDIDYRDYRVTGDCKFAWEPSRHHQLVTLGRAYRVTGEERYAESLLEQMESWIEQCPFGEGMQWRSPLELGIRMINWVWALELIRPSQALTRERTDRIAAVAYRHLWDIARKYSRYSSANNHLIGEAAGVFIGASYFSGLRNATAWRAESREILLNEILAQTYPDGGTREQAYGYHLFTLQFFLLAGLTARNDGDDLTPEYWRRLEKMFEFAAAFHEAGGAPAAFGDGDDGYVLDLGRKLADLPALMCVGAVLFDRPDFKTLAGGYHEPAHWLFGPEGRRRFDALAPGDPAPRLTSRAFSDSGYYLLQGGQRGRPDAMSVAFDCGELGFQSIAAHGHADALSFTLRVGGHDVLVDPGTYDYFTHERYRRYFRSTAAHNTITIDGRDQSEMLGSFMWGERAQATCLRWEPSAGGGTVCGEHDGYTRLSDPVRHRRTLTLDNAASCVEIHDEIRCRGPHDVCFHLHFSDRCQLELSGDHRLSVDFGEGKMSVEVDPRMSLSIEKGREDPIQGWVSRGYHRKTPSPTVVARCVGDGELSLRTKITVDEASAEAADCRSRADAPVCS